MMTKRRRPPPHGKPPTERPAPGRGRARRAPDLIIAVAPPKRRARSKARSAASPRPTR
jgi:hypothetical protein